MRTMSTRLCLGAALLAALGAVGRGQTLPYGTPSPLPPGSAYWSNYYPGDRGLQPVASDVPPAPPPGALPDIHHGPHGGEPCGPCDAGWGCTPCYQPCWYVAGGGVVMVRNRPRFEQLSFDDTDLVGQVLSTHTGVGSSYDGGAEFRVGRYLGCGAALEAAYWGIYGDNQEATVLGADLVGFLNTVFDLRPLNIGTDNVNDLFDAAAAHRVRRDYEVHNVELNLIVGGTPCGPSCGWNFSYLAGVRYFQFREDFQYASADANPVFGADPANEAYYDIDVDNDMVGFQLGARGDYYLTPSLRLYAAPKFGIYGNHMRQHSRIYNANGTAVVGPGNPLAGQEFDIRSSKTVTSFLGELDAGLNYQITPHWSAALGYRVVVVSNVALATDQIPDNFGDLPGVADIDYNATLIVHGAYARVQFSW
jgi:hypothetical protein